MRRSFKSILLTGAAAGAALLTMPAGAQGTQQDTAVAAGQGDSAQNETGLGEVVVTAERRSENIQRVPVSVAVVSGEDLRTFQTGGEDALALAGRVPACMRRRRPAASSRASTSAGWATSTSTSARRSRCRSSRTTWCWNMSC